MRIIILWNVIMCMKGLMEMTEKRFNCRDCKFHSSIRGEYVRGFDGYPNKIIYPSKLGHCLFYEWNLLNLNICKHFKFKGDVE